MPSSALLFPGQGSHAEGMDEPYRGHPLFERGLELLGYDPFERLTEGTRYQQPALFLCSIAAWDQWREEAEEEDEASAAAGHSLGEYAALVAAGALQFEDAVRLVDERAAAMADAGELNAGGMIAMLGGDGRRRARPGLAPGPRGRQRQRPRPARAQRARRRARSRPRTSRATRSAPAPGAWTSPAPSTPRSWSPPPSACARRSRPRPIGELQIPVYSNGSASPFVDVRRELAENLLRPVRWRETLLALRTARIERFVELGPGSVLTGLVKRTLQAAREHGGDRRAHHHTRHRPAPDAPAPARHDRRHLRHRRRAARPRHHQRRPRAAPGHQRRVDRAPHRHPRAPPPAGRRDAGRPGRRAPACSPSTTPGAPAPRSTTSSSRPSRPTA